LRYRFVTFGVSWNRGSTCSMSLLRILASRFLAGLRRVFRLGTGPAIGADSGWADSARGRYASRPGQLRQPPKNWSRSDTPLAGKYPNATTARRGHVEEDAPRVGFRRVASALDDVDGEAAECCLLVLRGHIRAGLAHRLDHLVEADSMLAVAPQRHPRGVD